MSEHKTIKMLKSKLVPPEIGKSLNTTSTGSTKLKSPPNKNISPLRHISRPHRKASILNKMLVRKKHSPKSHLSTSSSLPTKFSPKLSQYSPSKFSQTFSPC
jgi:hypothetical protein